MRPEERRTHQLHTELVNERKNRFQPLIKHFILLKLAKKKALLKVIAFNGVMLFIFTLFSPDFPKIFPGLEKMIPVTGIFYNLTKYLLLNLLYGVTVTTAYYFSISKLSELSQADKSIIDQRNEAYNLVKRFSPDSGCENAEEFLSTSSHEEKFGLEHKALIMLIPALLVIPTMYAVQMFDRKALVLFPILILLSVLGSALIYDLKFLTILNHKIKLYFSSFNDELSKISLEYQHKYKIEKYEISEAEDKLGRMKKILIAKYSILFMFIVVLAYPLSLSTGEMFGITFHYPFGIKFSFTILVTFALLCGLEMSLTKFFLSKEMIKYARAGHESGFKIQSRGASFGYLALGVDEMNRMREPLALAISIFIIMLDFSLNYYYLYSVISAGFINSLIFSTIFTSSLIALSVFFITPAQMLVKKIELLINMGAYESDEIYLESSLNK